MLEHTFTRQVSAEEMDAPRDCCGTNLLLIGVAVDVLLKLAAHTPCMTLVDPATLVLTTGYSMDPLPSLYVKVTYACDSAECRAAVEGT